MNLDLEILASLKRIEKLLEQSLKPVVINNTFAGDPANSSQAARVASDVMREVVRRA